MKATLQTFRSNIKCVMLQLGRWVKWFTANVVYKIILTVWKGKGKCATLTQTRIQTTSSYAKYCSNIGRLFGPPRTRGGSLWWILTYEKTNLLYRHYTGFISPAVIGCICVCIEMVIWPILLFTHTMHGWTCIIQCRVNSLSSNPTIQGGPKSFMHLVRWPWWE